MDFAALARLAAQHVDLTAIAGRAGLPPDMVELVVGSLLKNHPVSGDTVEQAAAETGVAPDQVSAVLEHMGGADMLGKLGGLAGNLPGGLGGLAGGLGGLFGKN